MKTVFSLFLAIISICGCIFEDSGVGGGQDAAGSVSDSEKDALVLAINDEYKARATYRRVIADFGEVRPFTNIVDAEEKHIRELETLFNKYGIDVPGDEWPAKVQPYTSIQDACAAGVQAEIDNAALYDRLFAKIQKKDITVTFRNLRDASEKNHLPAFKRCA